MYSGDNVKARELRLMAQRYAERGDVDKARQALEWTKEFEQFPAEQQAVCREEQQAEIETLLPSAPERSS